MTELIASFCRFALRSLWWWVALGAWILGWLCVRHVAPVLLVPLSNDPYLAIYNVVYVSALAGGLSSIAVFERFEALLRRAPHHWTLGALLVGFATSTGLFVAIALASLSFDLSRLASPGAGLLRVAWLLAITSFAAVVVATVPKLRGLRGACFVVVVVALHAAQPRVTWDDGRLRNLELVSRALPILGMCSIVALVARRAGSHR